MTDKFCGEIDQVENFDWNVKVVLSSSVTGQVFVPLTAVSLLTQRGTTLDLEVDANQLDQVISALDAALSASSAATVGGGGEEQE